MLAQKDLYCAVLSMAPQSHCSLPLHRKSTSSGPACADWSLRAISRAFSTRRQIPNFLFLYFVMGLVLKGHCLVTQPAGQPRSTRVDRTLHCAKRGMAAGLDLAAYSPALCCLQAGPASRLRTTPGQGEHRRVLGRELPLLNWSRCRPLLNDARSLPFSLDK